MTAYKRKDNGQIVQAMPVLQIMRTAQITPQALPHWMLSAWQEGRVSATYSAFFVRHDKGRKDEEVKVPSDYWLVETSPSHLEGIPHSVFIATYEEVTP